MNKGLTDEEVQKSRQKYGDNTISIAKKESFVRKLIATLGDPIIKILLIALAIKTLFLFQNFDWYETIGIVIAIFLASFISTLSEYGSEKAFEQLQAEASKIKTKVKRNQEIKEIAIDEVVVGDIIKLSSGDEIPADGEIISGKITVNGETKEIEKTKSSKVYRSTVVYSGIATMLVKKVGNQTVYGRLAEEINEKKPTSPLKLRLVKLAEFISKIGYIGADLVTISYLFSEIFINNNFELSKIHETITNFPLMFGYILKALTLSVTIIVVAVPEGLPMMITLVLSSNMKRMLKSHILVRKLMGIETAGNINILFTDKTGTITEGKLNVISLTDAIGQTYNDEKSLKQNQAYYTMTKLSLIANNDSDYDENHKPIGGNITDRAILEFFKDSNINYQIKEKIPFSSSQKYSITKVLYNQKEINLIKGAPEIILSKCTHYYENGRKRFLVDKKKIEKHISNAASKGIRVLAYATSETYPNPSRLSFLGLVFIKDEIRKEAIEGLNLIEKAHIKTIMLTGDNIETAKNIGKEIGLLKNKNDLIITSDELRQKTDNEVKEILPNLKIIARSLPQDKSRLVKIAQSLNLVVGMTGDGVNDAPALKKADVGFAMGSGTEVAKEASDIVILDDNLLSLSKAVLYGRTIFKSIRKFIIFQLTVNLCAVSISIIGPFIGVETPVTVIQMLWINMVMDTLAGIAFSFEPPLKEYMAEKPKNKKEPIINKYMLGEILFTGTFSALLCVFFLKSPLIHSIFRDGPNDKYLMTAFFGLFIFMSIFNSFNARTHRLNILANLSKNKVFLAIIIFIVIVQIYLMYYGGDLFRTYGLNPLEFEIMTLLALTVIPVDFIRKLYLRKRGKMGGV